MIADTPKRPRRDASYNAPIVSASSIGQRRFHGFLKRFQIDDKTAARELRTASVSTIRQVARLGIQPSGALRRRIAAWTGALLPVPSEWAVPVEAWDTTDDRKVLRKIAPFTPDAVRA